MRLDGTVAMVTGGARRLGRAMALGLAEAGCDVFLHYGRSKQEVGCTAGDIAGFGRTAVAISADLTQPDEIDRLFEAFDATFHRLDVLVNSAASFTRTPFDEATAAEWDEIHALNLRAPFLMTQHAARRMRQAPARWEVGGGPAGDGEKPGDGHEQPGADASVSVRRREGGSERLADGANRVRTRRRGGGAAPGAIVNIADMAGVAAWRDFTPHGVSKAGILHLTRTAARELGPDVRVNAIVPGPILPPPGETEDDEQWQRRGLRMPLQRTGSPENVAHAAVFLAENDYVTGATLHVDGGEHLLTGGRT